MTKPLSPEAAFVRRCRNPFYFIEMMWGLKPQPCYTRYESMLKTVPPEEWKAEWFGKEIEKDRWDWHNFHKGKHITWQQCAIIEGVRLAVENYGTLPNKIAVKSGNGIGKTCDNAWLILWFLFAFPDCQVPCTAPTSSQINDVLWKEIGVWIGRMPKVYRDVYDHTAGYVRIKESPDTWFARARTSRKEAPEAFSGVHAKNVMAIADEASGVPDIIFEYGKGIMTSEFWLFLMFSNPTRTVGTFRKAFKEGSGWRQYTFNSTQSPVVDHKFVEEKKMDSGYDSDDYRVFVLGEFPNADAMDDQGYIPAFIDSDITNAEVSDANAPMAILGVDPSGEGHDKSAFVGRNAYVSKILAEEQISTPKSVAMKACTFISHYDIEPYQTVIDNFGSGANVALEIERSGFESSPINVGMPASDKRFLNKRAEIVWAAREWIKKGGMLVRDPRWKQLLNIRYRYNEAGKLQIMSKEKMKKEGIPSPDFADAWFLTFAVEDVGRADIQKDKALETEFYKLSGRNQFTP